MTIKDKKTNNRIIFIFGIFLFVSIQFITHRVYGLESDEFLDTIEQKEDWPDVSLIESGEGRYNASDSGDWSTKDFNRYYNWYDSFNSKAINTYLPGEGEITNEYGTLQHVQNDYAEIRIKNMPYTTPDGEDVYFHRIRVGDGSEKDEDECFNKSIDLDFYDRFGGLGYEQWVFDKFKNQPIPGKNGKESFSNLDLLRQAANLAVTCTPANENSCLGNPYYQYVKKNADPDKDGFWAPYGGYDAEENHGNGGGKGSSEHEPSELGECLQPWVDRLESGGIVTVETYNGVTGESKGEVEIHNMDELYAYLADGWYGFQTLIKWKCGKDGPCPTPNGQVPNYWYGPDCDPDIPPEDQGDACWEYPLTNDNLNSTAAGKTFVAVEPLLIDLIRTSDPPRGSGCPNYDEFEFTEELQTPNNGVSVQNYVIEFNMALPMLREKLKVGFGAKNPDPLAGWEMEEGITLEKLKISSDAEGTIYELGAPIVSDGKDFSLVIDAGDVSDEEGGCLRFFDLTNLKIEFSFKDPWTDPTDPLDTVSRLATYLMHFETFGGPEKEPFNYYSRCGDYDEESGEVDVILCEHSFPHAKDTGKNGEMGVRIDGGYGCQANYYITGNYLDVDTNCLGHPEDYYDSRPDFTNYEEFVWDTHPLTPNTSTDGNMSYGDEAMIAGAGQKSITFSEKYINDYQGKNTNIGLFVEGVTKRRNLNRKESSFWIGTVTNDENGSFETKSIKVDIVASNNEDSTWSMPTVGQSMHFLASISNPENDKVVKTAKYTWVLRKLNEAASPLNSVSAGSSYIELDRVDNVVGLSEYNEFVIEDEGTYRVEVIVEDKDGRKGGDTFDFDVNGDFIVEHPLGIRGDIVSIKANLEGLGLDANSPIVWKIDGQQRSEFDNSQVIDVPITKSSGTFHEVTLTAVNRNAVAGEGDIRTSINIPVVDPEIIITGARMASGSTEKGVYSPGESVTLTAIPGPSGSTWDDVTRSFFFTWTPVYGRGINEDAYSKTIETSELEKGIYGFNVFVETLQQDEITKASALGSIVLTQEKVDVQGVLAKSMNLVKENWHYFMLAISVGLMIYLVMKKRNQFFKKIQT